MSNEILNNNTINSLRDIIKKNLDEELFIPISEIKDDDDLFVIGIDSLNIIKIIIAIEVEFGIEFDDLDLKPENIGSLKSLENYILNKTKSI